MKNQLLFSDTSDGHILVDISDNKTAHNLFSTKLNAEILRLRKLAGELYEKKELTLEKNKVSAKFVITGKFLYTTYSLQGYGEATRKSKFDSWAANNDPENELLLAITKAECDLELSKNSDNLVLNNYHAFGFYVPVDETQKFKFKLRNFARRHFLYRFR